MFQPATASASRSSAPAARGNHLNLCNFTAYMRHRRRRRRLLRLRPQHSGLEHLHDLGVHVPQLSVEVLFALAGLASRRSVCSRRQPGDAVTLHALLRRRQRRRLRHLRRAQRDRLPPHRHAHGTVTAGGNPAARADIAVLGNPADGPVSRR
jgi:hypothetical protein